MKRGQSLAIPVRLPEALGGQRLAYWQLILLLILSIYAVSAALTLVQEDPYSTLGVAQDATPAELKRAYRAMARKVHPDKHHGADAAATFRKVKDAYELLINETTRAEYDESPMWERFVAPLTDQSIIFASSAFNVPTVASEMHWSQTITASFLHFNVLHLAFNCWRLWRFGEGVEQRLGQRAFVLTFVLGGAVGNVLFALVDGSPHVGATASVFALIGAAFADAREQSGRWINRQNSWIILSFLAEVLLVRFVEEALHDEEFMEGIPPINYWAHLGGFAGGLLVMELVLRLRRNRRNGESIAYLLAGACLIGACLAALHFYSDLVASGAWALLRRN